MAIEREDAEARKIKELLKKNGIEAADAPHEHAPRRASAGILEQLDNLVSGPSHEETGGYLGMGLEDPWGVGTALEGISDGLSSLARPSSPAPAKKPRGSSR